MFVLLRNCLIKQPQDEDPDEGVRDLVEIALRKLDIDKDGKVSFQDYQTAVTEEPLLLEGNYFTWIFCVCINHLIKFYKLI